MYYDCSVFFCCSHSLRLVPTPGDPCWGFSQGCCLRCFLTSRAVFSVTLFTKAFDMLSEKCNGITWMDLRIYLCINLSPFYPALSALWGRKNQEIDTPWKSENYFYLDWIHYQNVVIVLLHLPLLYACEWGECSYLRHFHNPPLHIGLKQCLTHCLDNRSSLSHQSSLSTLHVTHYFQRISTIKIS